MSARLPTYNYDAIRPVECVREGKEMLGDHYWLMVGICLAGTFLAGMAPFYLLFGPMYCGIYFCLLKLTKNEPVEFADLFKGFGFFGPAFLVGLFEMLPMLVIGLPIYVVWIILNITLSARPGEDEYAPFVFGGLMIGLAVLAIASAIVRMLCAFSFPLVIEWKLSGWDAVRVSAQAIRANLGGAFGLVALDMLLWIGGYLICGFGLFLTIPLIHAGWAVAYRRVFPEYPHHLDVPPDPPKWQEWTGDPVV